MYAPPSNMNLLRKAFMDLEGNSKEAMPVYLGFIKMGDKSNVSNAYIGALECVLANEQSNPLSKLSWFNKGKNKIESAIKMDSGNAEIRFLRLAIQINAPSFLFYNGSIEEDKKMIINKINSFDEFGIKADIIAFLKEKASLSNEQKKKIGG